MDKEEIEKIALEVYAETDWFSQKLMSTEQSACDYASRFLARVDALRAKKGAVAWRQETRYLEPYYLYHGTEPKRGKYEPLFLHPQHIPEGYKLVPVIPTKEMYEAGENTFTSSYTGTPISTPGQVWDAMIKASPEGKS